MTAAPFRAKAEERAKLLKKDEDESERPAKRMCSQYEKQMAKMSGDLQVVKDTSKFVFRNHMVSNHMCIHLSCWDQPTWKLGYVHC